MAKNQKEVEFTIKNGGIVEADQQGYEGKGCAGDIKVILDALGGKAKTTKKQEYRKGKEVHITQKR